LSQARGALAARSAVKMRRPPKLAARAGRAPAIRPKISKSWQT
jgi:hypothetical protein